MKLIDNLNDVWLYSIDSTNYICFRKDNRSHHINGPSSIQSTGYKQYRISGFYHNTKGSAYIYASGRKSYYLNGRLLSKKEWQNATKG